MKFKSKQIQDAMEHLKYTLRVPMDSADIEVTLRDEDLEANKLMSCMTMVVTYESKPGQYDNWKGMKSTKHTVEIFPESEGGRDLQITTEESYALPPRKN